MKLLKNNDWPLIRFIAPAFPEVNIFTGAAKKTTPLGPISVATAANKVRGWRVEVVDENNFNGPRDKWGLPDHEKLQQENFASVVGFYSGLSSTMERVFELAEFYRRQKAINVAGGWHAHYCPEEALKGKIDIVVHGDGEILIERILTALNENETIANIPGISFWENNLQRINPPAMFEVPSLDQLPYPDFGLLKYARKLKIYPIGRVRGCGMNCEFCSVKGGPRWASARHLFSTVNWLVETRKADYFFIVDDRLEEDIRGTLEFFRMISEKYGNRLSFTVQIRLEAARNSEFLEVMKKAGVRVVCIGYESPIDEDLMAMRKGYLSYHMIEWTKILRRYFWVHGMFIFGYPHKKKGEEIGAQEMAKRFKNFIRRSRIDSVQVLHPVPLVGTDLRSRLKKEGRIFPLDLVPWRMYDGSYACFIPDNMSVAELQEIPIKLMQRFYDPLSLLRIPLRTIAFPLDYLIRGWQRWHRGWLGEIIKYGGHRLIQGWQKRQKHSLFLTRLEDYKKSILEA